MGVDTKVTLPANTRVGDVAEVLGLAAGLEGRMRDIGDRGYKALRVDGAKVEPSGTSPEMVVITLKDPNERRLIDGQSVHTAYYFFEWDSAPVASLTVGARGLYLRSTPFWIACATRVVDFFGGMIDYNDCDDRDVDYVAEGTAPRQADDGDPWQAYEDAKAVVDPITRLDLERASQHAAYPLEVSV